MNYLLLVLLNIFLQKQVLSDLILERCINKDNAEKNICRKLNKVKKVYICDNRWGNVPMNTSLCSDYCHIEPDLKKANLIVWHVYTKTHYPMNISNHQILISFGQEPKNLAYNRLHDKRVNYFSTFKLNSDIPLPYLNHNFYKSIYSLKIPSLEEYTRRKNVLFVSSNCIETKRLSYISELMKSVEIDSRGLCLNSGKKPRGIWTNLEYYYKNTYKFYIGFEKSIELDYNSEKFQTGFLLNSVPIYMGHERAFDFAPKNSFIDMRKFKTPRDLGKYINYLSGNYSAWIQYFEYRTKNMTERQFKLKKWIEYAKSGVNGGNLCRYCDHVCNKE